MTTKTHFQKLGRMIAMLAVIATVAAPVASADVWARQGNQVGDVLDRYVANISRLPDALDRYLANRGTRPDDRAVLPRIVAPTEISAGSASQVDWNRLGISVGVGGAVLLIVGMVFTTRRRLAHS